MAIWEVSGPFGPDVSIEMEKAKVGRVFCARKRARRPRARL